MTKWVRYSEQEEAELQKWLDERPQVIRDMIEKYGLRIDTLYRYTKNNRNVIINSFDEDGTVGVMVRQKANPHIPLVMERDVFGVDPADLEPCVWDGEVKDGVIVWPDEAGNDNAVKLDDFFKTAVQMGGSFKPSASRVARVWAWLPPPRKDRVSVLFDSLEKAKAFQELLDSSDESGADHQYRSSLDTAADKDDQRKALFTTEELRRLWQPKFGPQHFPAGTIFRCEDLSEVTFRAICVTNNDVGSYIVQCESADPAPTPPLYDIGFQAYNIEHVTHILKAGDGGMLDGREARRRKVVSDLHRDALMMTPRLSHKSQGEYYRNDVAQLIYGIMLEKGLIRSFDNAPAAAVGAVALLALSWCKPVHVRFGRSFQFIFYRINKKKLHRFIQQNHNRWKKRVKDEIRAADEDQMRYLETSDDRHDDYNQWGDHGD